MTEPDAEREAFLAAYSALGDDAVDQILRTGKATLEIGDDQIVLDYNTPTDT